jgi:hypothetical protein
MTKPTSTKPTKSDHVLTTAENRSIVLEMMVKYNLPMVELTGNTFPVKGLLWTNGGTFNKETKTWSVPAQVAEEMQKAVNDVSAKVAASIAKSKAKKEAAETEILPVA